MNSPKIAVLGLGGTIAMRSEGTGAVPALAAEDLVAVLPADAADLVGPVENFRRLPGAHLELDDLVALAARIQDLSDQGEADGFVVVQGTDQEGLRLRARPSTKARVVTTLKEGTSVTVLEGPEEADGYTLPKPQATV